MWGLGVVGLVSGAEIGRRKEGVGFRTRGASISNLASWRLGLLLHELSGTPLSARKETAQRSPVCFEKGFTKESLGGLGLGTFRGWCGAHVDNCGLSGSIPSGIVSALLFRRKV